MDIKATPGSILDLGFKTFFKEWWQLLIVTLVFSLPSLALLALPIQSVGTTSALSVALTVLAVLFGIALFIAVVKLSQDRMLSNKHSTFEGLFRFICKNYISLLLTMLLTVLIGIGMFILSLIPITIVGFLFYGLYLLVMASNMASIIVTGFGSVIVLLLLVIAFIVIFSHLMFSPYVVLFHGKRYMAAIRRSLQLVKSKFWNVIGNTVILLLVGFAITVVLTLMFLPLLMAFQGSMTSTVVLTFIQQYVSLPVSIAFVALFFAVDNAVSSESLTNGSNHVLKVMARSIRRNSLGYKKPASKSKKKTPVSRKKQNTTSSSSMKIKVDTKSVKQSPSKKTEKTSGTKKEHKKAPEKHARPLTDKSEEPASSSSKVIKKASRQGRRKKI